MSIAPFADYTAFHTHHDVVEDEPTSLVLTGRKPVVKFTLRKTVSGKGEVQEEPNFWYSPYVQFGTDVKFLFCILTSKLEQTVSENPLISWYNVCFPHYTITECDVKALRDLSLNLETLSKKQQFMVLSLWKHTTSKSDSLDKYLHLARFDIEQEDELFRHMFNLAMDNVECKLHHTSMGSQAEQLVRTHFTPINWRRFYRQNELNKRSSVFTETVTDDQVTYLFELALTESDLCKKLLNSMRVNVNAKGLKTAWESAGSPVLGSKRSAHKDFFLPGKISSAVLYTKPYHKDGVQEPPRFTTADIKFKSQKKSYGGDGVQYDLDHNLIVTDLETKLETLPSSGSYASMDEPDSEPVAKKPKLVEDYPDRIEPYNWQQRLRNLGLDALVDRMCDAGCVTSIDAADYFENLSKDSTLYKDLGANVVNRLRELMDTC